MTSFYIAFAKFWFIDSDFSNLAAFHTQFFKLEMVSSKQYQIKILNKFKRNEINVL